MSFELQISNCHRIWLLFVELLISSPTARGIHHVGSLVVFIIITGQMKGFTLLLILWLGHGYILLMPHITDIVSGLSPPNFRPRLRTIALKHEADCGIRKGVKRIQYSAVCTKVFILRKACRWSFNRLKISCKEKDERYLVREKFIRMVLAMPWTDFCDQIKCQKLVLSRRDTLLVRPIAACICRST